MHTPVWKGARRAQQRPAVDRRPFTVRSESPYLSIELGGDCYFACRHALDLLVTRFASHILLIMAEPHTGRSEPMQPSARQQELERPYYHRRGHLPKISISDESHHVTEAIGSYYDEDDGLGTSPPSHHSRPLSFVKTPTEGYTDRSSRREGSYFDLQNRPLLKRRESDDARAGDGQLSGEAGDSQGPGSVQRMSSLASEHGANVANGQSSPPLPSRQNSGDTANQQFPLNDIDYESSPAAVAQELSNLQAIRRMSMNVDAADPDLPGFGGGFAAVPTIAPKGDAEGENDASRLFWVPARLHPELAPKEFRTFIEDRVDKIRRRSGEGESPVSEGLDQTGSANSLRRKKSMLSHQVDPKGSYEDGAERLERKRSRGVGGMEVEGETRVELAELEHLAHDPVQLMRRMSLSNARTSEDSAVEVPSSEDRPILPPVSQSLKRSTRTTYRKGSLKRGERVPFSKRALQRRKSEAEDSSSREPRPSEAENPPPALELTRVPTEPVDNAPGASARLSDERPAQTDSQRRKEPTMSAETTGSASEAPEGRREVRGSVDSHREEEPQGARHPPRQFQSRLASGAGRTTAQLPGYTNTNPLPNVIETLPDGTKVPSSHLIQQIPERKLSHELPRGFQRGGAHMRPVPGREPRRSTLDDISGRPSPFPGSGGTRTDALTMVPTFEERKKDDKKDGSGVGRKSSWKWILGTDDEKSKDSSSSDTSSGARGGRSGKLSKINSDRGARLDVLQHSIDNNSSVTGGARGRESMVLNRDDVRLEEERGKQTQKRMGESKKDSSSLLSLSSIFSSRKKSPDGAREGSVKKSWHKHSSRDRPTVSPEPSMAATMMAYRVLRPDIDYNWTRFSILEERAIYRMAHIKLANPRRALYSQVLLSNFMYSYLAKVQMMHPQMAPIPAAHQKKEGGYQQQQAQQQQQQQSEPREYQQWVAVS